VTCSCSRDALCDQCVDDGFAQLRGVAACRGEYWAAHLPASSRPWNAAKAIAIARLKVADLARDPRLLERLAAELVRWAQRRWRS
jgi:hypothetical protein